jgi:hypothetical protein
MKNIIIGLIAFLLAQSQNYIEIDGKRTYVNSMTPQEIVESERTLKDQERVPTIKPAPRAPIETVVVQPHPVIIYREPAQSVDPQYYDRSIRVRIENKRLLDKEYYESTGPGSFKKVEVLKGKKVEESWKMEGGNLVKERKEVK